MKDTLIMKVQNGCWALGLLALSVSALAAESVDAPPDARLDELKREAVAEVDNLSKFTQVAVDTIFSYGELGFQEFETSRYVTGLLTENGFDVEMGMAGMPTAWMARWGSGEPVIAFGSDIDGIPKSSQSRVSLTTTRSSRVRPGTVRDTTRARRSTSPQLWS